MMGAKLARAAYSIATADRFQDHRSFRLWNLMALTARDADPHPAFYGGEEALLAAIAGSDAKTMRVSLRRLQDAGYLVRDERKARTGRRMTYYLLDGKGGPLRPVRTTRESGSIAPSRAGEHRPVSATEVAGRFAPRDGEELPREPGSSTPPKEYEEKKEEVRASAPTRTCKKHSSWDGPNCWACQKDREAAEAHMARRRSTMSPASTDCGHGNHRWMAPERSGHRTCRLCPVLWRKDEEEP